MRLLLMGLLISVGALLFVAGAVTWHVLRQRRVQFNESSEKSESGDLEIEFPDVADSKTLASAKPAEKPEN
jgi:hypothetical protein